MESMGGGRRAGQTPIAGVEDRGNAGDGPAAAANLDQRTDKRTDHLIEKSIRRNTDCQMWWSVEEPALRHMAVRGPRRGSFWISGLKAGKIVVAHKQPGGPSHYWDGQPMCPVPGTAREKCRSHRLEQEPVLIDFPDRRTARVE